MTNLDRFKAEIKSTNDPIKIATIVSNLQADACKSCENYSDCKQRIYGRANCIVGLVNYFSKKS